jgi:hypothetical protein
MSGRGHKESKAHKDPIAVYEMVPGEQRQPFTYHGKPIEYLPPDAPMPRVGDILLLPKVTAHKKGGPTTAWGGIVVPFVVVEIEHVYHRSSAKSMQGLEPKPAKYVRSVVNARALTDEEYLEGPGTCTP